MARPLYYRNFTQYWVVVHGDRDFNPGVPLPSFEDARRLLLRFTDDDFARRRMRILVSELGCINLSRYDDHQVVDMLAEHLAAGRAQIHREEIERPALSPVLPEKLVKKPKEQTREETTWIEVTLVDEQNNPVPGVRYELFRTKGTPVSAGALDSLGLVRVTGIKAGSYKVGFPELDREFWCPSGLASREARGVASVHVVEQGDCIESIAFKHGLFWQTVWDHPQNRELRERCNTPGLLGPGDSIRIPEKLQHWETVESGRRHQFTLRADLAQRLESTFALDQFTGLAKILSRENFIVWCGGIFGYDLQPKHYDDLRTDLLAGKFRNPEIVLSPAKSGGHAAWYDRKQGQINVYQPIPELAEKDEQRAWKLLEILLHEFGHHIDHMARNHYSKVGGDAELDEGAKTAYALVYWDLSNKAQREFATYYRRGGKTTLAVKYQDVHKYFKKWKLDQDAKKDEQTADKEFFGAGMGNGTCSSYAHEKIELVLRSHGLFSKEEFSRIYFGNWMRDFSQVVDPMLVRYPKEQNPRWYALSRPTLSYIVHFLALAHFGEDKAGGKYVFKVTDDRLGVYRPEEHVDNPLGLPTKIGGHKVTDIDNDFFEGLTDPNDPRLKIDPKTWMKRYITWPSPSPQRSPRCWGSPTECVKKNLAAAYKAGRTDEGLRHFGAALHCVEDIYAHSNFVELTLRKLGHKVIMWSKKMDNGHYPFVTGVFGGADTVATLGYEISAKLDGVLECKPGEIGKGAEIALLILADKGRDPKKEPAARQELEAYLNALSEFEKEHPVLSTFMCRTIGYIGVAVKNTVGYWAYLASKEIDGFQSKWGRGLNPENPTHSQLSKDHDDHPLHVIAAECAAEASLTVGKAMEKAWAGKKTLAEVQNTALSYFFHPKHVCLFAAGDTIPDAQVLFSKKSAMLDGKDQHVLRQVKDVLDADSALVVDIWAYANDGGSLAADKKLSNQRGDAVKDYLVSDLKIPRSQIGAVVPGSTGPSVLDSYQTDEKQAQRGRRVEFRVVKASAGTKSQQSILRKIEMWSKQPANQKAIKQAGSKDWAWGQVKKVEQTLKKLDKVQKDPWGAAVRFYQQLDKLRREADAKKLKERAKEAAKGAKELGDAAKKKYEGAKEDAKAIKDKELPSAKRKAKEVGGKALEAEEPVPGAKQTQKALEGVLGEKK